MRLVSVLIAAIAGCLVISGLASAEVTEACDGEMRPARGLSLYNGEVEFEALLIDGEYRLIDCERGIFTYDLHGTTAFDKARHVSSADGDFSADGQRVAVSVHWAAQRLYDFYAERFGRKGYDDAYGPLKQYVHYGSNYFNAMFDKGVVIYGDGGAYNSTPIASVDYVGHEITHGVILTTAGLIYQGESGALNESFADIVAKIFEHHMFGDAATWDMFPEIYRDSGMSTRSMREPQTPQVPWDDTAETVLRRRGAQGKRTVLRSLAKYYLGPGWESGSGDNGGVYANSGPNSHWFYLLSEGGGGTNHLGHSYKLSGIGIEKAGDIAWRSLTTYLFPNADYLDTRYASEQAAIDLFGAGSPEFRAVCATWDAVAVTEENYRTIRRVDRNVKYIALLEGDKAYDAAAGEGFPHPSPLTGPEEYSGAEFWYLHSSSAVSSYPEFLSYQNWPVVAGRGYEIRFTERGGKAMFIDVEGDRGVKPVPFEVWVLGADLLNPDDDVRMVPVVFDIDKNDEFGLFGQDESPWNYSSDHPALPGERDFWTDMLHVAAPQDVSAGEAGYLAFESAGRDEIADTHLSWLAFLRPEGGARSAPATGQTFRLVLSRKDGAQIKMRPEPIPLEQ